jgi:sarcosine oxidase
LNLLVPTDMVVFGADDVSALQRWANPSLAGWARASYETMRADGYECELLSRAALQARFTNLACDDRHQFAFIDHTAALIHASTAVRQIARLAHAAGATLLPYHTVEHVVRTGDDVNGLIVNGDRIVPRRGVIFAAGWQNSTLRPELAAKTRVTRQHIVRFRAQYGFRQPDGDLPIIVDLDDRRYLYALAGRTITVADDDSRPASKRVSDPSSSYGSPALDEAFVAEAHTFATTRVPELRGMTVLADTSCHYTSTVAGDYLVYQQGNVVVVSACSGHGFKNGPSIGRMAAEMAMKQRPRNYHPFYAFEHAQDIP